MNKGLFCFLTNPREINIDKDPVNYLPHTQKNTNCSLESPLCSPVLAGTPGFGKWPILTWEFLVFHLRVPFKNPELLPFCP